MREAMRSAKLRLRELARIPKLKLADEDFFDTQKWDAAFSLFKEKMAKFVAVNPKGGLLVGKPVIHPAGERWGKPSPTTKSSGVTLISPSLDNPGKWRTTHFLRQKVLGKTQADYFDKSDYANGAMVPHSHTTHETLAKAYEDAASVRGGDARFTKKNIFSAKLRLRELAAGSLRLVEMGYTKPELRERIKARIMASGKGGRPGQWSARKAQLVAQEYRAEGGGYKGGKTKSQKSLRKWTREKWGTRSGKPSTQGPEATGERYLPESANKALSPQEYGATTRAKREGTRRGEQFVRQPERIAKKTAPHR